MGRIWRRICGLLLAALLAGAAGTALAAEETAYIVRFREPVQAGPELRPISEAHGLYWSRDRALLAGYEAAGQVEYIEEDCRAILDGDVGDPYHADQWSLASLGVDILWEQGLTGEGVTVAIVDSGLNVDHEDLQGADILPGYNVMDESDDVTDHAGHGSFVAGIIAAVRDNGKGIAGMAEGVTLAPVKCFSRIGETDTRYVLQAIYAAVDEYDCDVMNLSLGMDRDLRSMREAIAYAVEHGVIVVSAVGNEGTEEMMYPAAYNGVIGVGSVGRSGKRSDFSEHNSSVFVMAPGEVIISIGHDTPEAYDLGSGTSFAVPHVTALAALARSVSPELSPEAFRELLIQSSLDCGEPGYDTDYGWGVIQPAGLLRLLGVELPEEEPESDEPSHRKNVFTDLINHWAQDNVLFCVELGIFGGMSETQFAPDAPMSRAMLATVLWRMEGKKQVQPMGFADVTDPSVWYYEAVNWAAQQGIVEGFDGREFRPEQNLTREQLAVMLWRYAGMADRPSGDAGEETVLPFDDGQEVSPWAREAVAWCHARGLMDGMGGNLFAPAQEATRAQVAVILYRFLCLPSM